MSFLFNFVSRDHSLDHRIIAHGIARENNRNCIQRLGGYGRPYNLTVCSCVAWVHWPDLLMFVCILHGVQLRPLIESTIPLHSIAGGGLIRLTLSSCVPWQRLGIPRRWTTAVEQPSVQHTTVRPYPSAVPPGVKDVFVRLTETPAPSDFLFVVCYTNALTYLLTSFPDWVS